MGFGEIYHADGGRQGHPGIDQRPLGAGGLPDGDRDSAKHRLDAAGFFHICIDSICDTKGI